MARKKSKSVKTVENDLANPQTRTEGFLAKIAGLSETLPQGEFSRLERYLKYIAENSGGGGFGNFVESTDYPGCFYQMVGEEAEWLNPPMVADVEYRTFERFNNKPVYALFFNFGKGVSGTESQPGFKTQDYSVIDTTRIVSISANRWYSTPDSVSASPMYSSYGKWQMSAYTAPRFIRFVLTSYEDNTDYDFSALIKYIKA